MWRHELCHPSWQKPPVLPRRHGRRWCLSRNMVEKQALNLNSHAAPVEKWKLDLAKLHQTTWNQTFDSVSVQICAEEQKRSKLLLACHHKTGAKPAVFVWAWVTKIGDRQPVAKLLSRSLISTLELENIVMAPRHWRTSMFETCLWLLFPCPKILLNNLSNLFPKHLPIPPAGHVLDRIVCCSASDVHIGVGVNLAANALEVFGGRCGCLSKLQRYRKQQNESPMLNSTIWTLCRLRGSRRQCQICACFPAAVGTGADDRCAQIGSHEYLRDLLSLEATPRQPKWSTVLVTGLNLQSCMQNAPTEFRFCCTWGLEEKYFFLTRVK